MLRCVVNPVAAVPPPAVDLAAVPPPAVDRHDAYLKSALTNPCDPLRHLVEPAAARLGGEALELLVEGGAALRDAAVAVGAAPLVLELIHRGGLVATRACAAVAALIGNAGASPPCPALLARQAAFVTAGGVRVLCDVFRKCAPADSIDYEYLTAALLALRALVATPAVARSAADALVHALNVNGFYCNDAFNVTSALLAQQAALQSVVPAPAANPEAGPWGFRGAVIQPQLSGTASGGQRRAPASRSACRR